MEINFSRKISSFKNKDVLITVGMFDGLHRGHQYFLKSFMRLADDLNLEPLLVGLYPHPRKVLYNLDFQSLTTIEERVRKLSEFGLSNYLLLQSSKELLSLNATKFLGYLTDNGLNVRAVAMGYNNRFGRPVDDERSLEEQVESLGLDFYRVAPYCDKVSSTLVREALSQGRVEYANSLLGYSYSLSGRVVPGNQIGRSIGFPTANLKVNVEEKLIPSLGVYAVSILYKDQEYPAMMNIGYRPTIKEKMKELFMEAHVFNHKLNLYDETLLIKFFRKVRDEKQFASLDDLKMQLSKDKDFILQYFNSNFAHLIKR